jgi:LuxR family quorum sensing-dependent transcriptional regulator
MRSLDVQQRREPDEPAAATTGEFADALAACNAIADVKTVFKAHIAPHGFTASACGAFVPTDSGPESHFFFQDWPPEWIALYQRRNFVAVDYVVAEARRRIAPFTWLEAKAQRRLSHAEQKLWDTAADWGWTDGLSVPIHGPGGYFALVAMAGKKQPMPPELRGRLHLMALMTHERCRTLTGLALVAPTKAAFTPRELECLRWVAAGKTDPEIGTILSIVATTVRFHVDAARKKLGAQTRAHAVARLVMRGLS